MNVKTCIKCSLEKEEILFTKRGNGKFNNECKECNNIRVRTNKTTISIIIDEKECSKCNIIKEVKFFPKRTYGSVDGYRNECKECYNKRARSYEYHKLEDNKIKAKVSLEKWKSNNKDYYKKYREDNRDFILEKRRCKYYKKMEEPLYRLSCAIRTRIYSSVNGVKCGKKTTDILGLSVEEFKLYLESKFEDWMSWDNYGKYNGELNYGWDIDHMIPSSIATNEIELLELNYYTNLQPLCSKINREIKKDRLEI